MNQKRQLSPPLAVIERRLFGVSAPLMEAVEAGLTSAQIAESVKKSREWADRQAGGPELAPVDEILAPAPMPAFLRELVSRRVAAVQARFDHVPTVGQIVEVRQILTPEPNQLDWVMQAPLYVLLDAQAEEPELWHGWLASAETDYAGWWDFVLQEEDAPFDPEAGMVQLWNPVRLYLPMAGRAVAQLAPARMQAVRALAGEFVTAEPPNNIKVWPGRVAVRGTLNGLEVVTGSPLGGETDPRRRYQQLYFHAADAVREPARLANAAPVADPAVSLLQRLIDAASRLGETLTLAPRVTGAMSSAISTHMTGLAGKSSVRDLVWRDVARIRVMQANGDGGGQLQISAVGDEAVTCELRAGGMLENRRTINPGEPAVDMKWDGLEPTVLLLKTAGSQSLELPLAD